MNLAALDLNLLVALDALLSEAHVGRAARKIGRSQPAVSHALNRLREMFADPLLVRAGGRMELTPRARALRQPLAETLGQVQAMLLAESFDPRKSSRRFLLMMHDHVMNLIVPPLVRRVQEEAPGVKLEVLPWQTAVSLRPERFHAIDLLISCTHHELAGFEREILFQDTEVTIARKGNHEASRLRHLKVFLEAAHVAVVGRGQTEDPVDNWLREEGLERRIALRVPGYLQALQAVAQSDLVAVVPRRLATSLAAPLALVAARPPIDPGQYEEYLFHPRRAVKDAASMWLRGLVLSIGRDFERRDQGRKEA